MNLLDLAYINRLAPYKVWTENGCDYLVETSYDLLFKIGFMDDYAIWPSGAYHTYSGRDAYVMQTAEVQEGKTKNFAALIVQKSNPRLKEILAEFDETISILTNKPQ